MTFFTRDLGFFDPKNRSRDYCIVCLAVGQHEVAVFVRGILRHLALNTEAKRMGKIVRASHLGIRVLQMSGTLGTTSANGPAAALTMTSSPSVAVNRATAVAETRGPAAGIEALDA